MNMSTIISSEQKIITELIKLNLLTQSVVDNTKEISQQFKNGFKQEIIEAVTESVKENSLACQNIHSNTMKNLYHKLAGTVVIIAGLFALIVRLFFYLQGGTP